MHVDVAAVAARGLEGDALSAFSLRLSYSKSMSAVKAYTSTAALGDAPTTPALPAPAPAPTAPVVTRPPADSPVTDAPVGDSTTPESTTAPVPSPATDAPSPTPVSSASQTIASFTKDVLSRLATTGENSTAKFSMRWKIEFLVSALSSVASPRDADAQPAVKALGDSLAA